VHLYVSGLSGAPFGLRHEEFVVVAGVLDESEWIIYNPLTMTQRFLILGYLYFLAHAGGLDV
jgi:hypothetical protein